MMETDSLCSVMILLHEAVHDMDKVQMGEGHIVTANSLMPWRSAAL
jgi:hypothetical protein